MKKKHIHIIEQQIKKQERLALGYESMMDFYYGYIKALFVNKLISKSEYLILKKVYSWENDQGQYSIDDDGKLAIDKEEDDE
jgi:hypothetical protein